MIVVKHEIQTDVEVTAETELTIVIRLTVHTLNLICNLQCTVTEKVLQGLSTLVISTEVEEFLRGEKNVP